MMAVDAYVDAQTYESLSGVTKAQYEERLRRRVLYDLAEQAVHLTPLDGPERWCDGSIAAYDGTVESVVLEGTGSATSVVVRFRMSERPACVFAMRAVIWPVPPPDAPYEEGRPEEYGELIALNFDEDIATKWWKWKDCAPDQAGLVWPPDPADF